MNSLFSKINSEKPYRILSFPTHERTQSNMDKVDALFYLFNKPPHIKQWNKEFAPLPENHFLLPNEYIPKTVDFDFVLSQNRFGQFQIAQEMSRILKVPLINIEHTLPLKTWTKPQFDNIKNFRGHVNVYISKFSSKIWQEPTPYLMPHCVDVNRFKPGNKEVYNNILTVANDYIGRDEVLGYSQYKRVTKDLPTCPVGDSPGLSKAAKDVDDLVNSYQQSSIFLNTSTWSPIPTSLLEAMSCGCACVSTNNCAIPDYIDHGINGLLANSDEEMREYLERLLKDEDLRAFLGENARKTILEKCSKDNYTKQWNTLFDKIQKGQLRHES